MPARSIAFTSDGGSTWTYPLQIRNDKFLNNSHRADLYGGVSCSDNLCIATGSYDHDETRWPLLARSIDLGKTWQYIPLMKMKLLPESTLRAEFLNGASCSGLLCIATGYYASRRSTHPLLLLTNNGGATWTFPHDLHSKMLPKPFVYGKFNSASCNGNTCVATGYYKDGERMRPLLAVTMDAGKTWRVPTEITHPKELSSFKEGQLIGGASCNDTHCIASGFYQVHIASGTKKDMPLLARSMDKGLTWTYATKTTTEITLPDPFFSGGLNGKAVSDP